MLTAMLVIAGFQIYWLVDNYRREKRELETKTSLLFRETYRQLQDSVLRDRLQFVLRDSSGNDTLLDGAIRIASGTSRALGILNEQLESGTTSGKEANMTITVDKPPRDFMMRRKDGKPIPLDSIPPDRIKKINIVSNQAVLDSIKSIPASTGFHRTRPTALAEGRDSFNNAIVEYNTIYIGDSKQKRFVFRVDSLLSDSARLQELHRKFDETLLRENIDVPYEIIQVNEPAQLNFARTSSRRWQPGVFDSTPFSLQLGNSMPYLLKRLGLPILFSAFLIGITCFSFILLYRSLRHQQRLARLKTELVSNITHELKTPIATVGVAIEALKNFNAIQDPERTKEYLDISQKELQRLGLLVDKVLNLSMFEKKDVEIETQLFNFADLVQEVTASMRLQLDKYHARLTVDTTGDLSWTGDRTHFQSVVFNLIDNALKYSKLNPAIHIELIGSDDQVQLKVTDNGIGISEPYQKKVFEKFFRVPAGDTHNAKGHGLGLSYIAQVVHRHGGTIELDSHPGLGSTFTIRLPRHAKGAPTSA